jgi:alkanesulfonate monooxygenase SsuD/methylene tetrahydromethanopterin reductase-like flavin-dependent oxidoreductase (luciferase family)
MPQIKVGVQIRPQHTTYAEYEQAWLRADALGADSIWNWDHFFPLSGDPDGPHFGSPVKLVLRLKIIAGVG